MKKQIILLNIFGILLAQFIDSNAIAQQPDFLFEQQYPYEWQYGGTHSLEIRSENGNIESYFIATCDLSTIGYTVGKEKSLNQDNPQPAKILKLSPEGTLLSEMTMNEEGRYSSIIQLYHDPFDYKYCIAVGTIQDSTLNYNKLYLAKFDHELNLSWRKEIELPEAYHNLFGGRSLMDSNGDIVLCFWPFNGSYWSYMLYLRLSSEGDLLAMEESPMISSIFYSTQGGLFEYNDGSGDYGQTFVGEPEGYSNPPVFMVRMNRDFTDFHTIDLIENIRLSETDGIFIGDNYSEAYTTTLPDGSKFMGCRGFRYDGFNPDLWDEVIVSMKLDQNDSLINVSFISHDNDSVRTMAFCHGMDMAHNETFYLCNGVYDPDSWQYGILDGLNRFEVTKTDANANIIWTRSYEDGLHIFQPCSVMATSDLGCLVTGRCWTLDCTEAELFVIKFFADGSFSIPEMKTHIRPYIFYPNPAQDYLTLQYSPNVKPINIELYDLQGHLLHIQKSDLEKVDIHNLAPGQYLIKVTFDNENTYSDKVVKE